MSPEQETTPNTRQPSRVMRFILPILILLIGIGGFLLLVWMKSSPQHISPEFRGVLTEVKTLQSSPHQVQIRATGTVQAEQEIALVPQVSGKVVWLSPKLVNGGFFQTGDTLRKIEADDYRLAVERTKAEVAGAEVSLAAEQERAKVARQEWQRISLPDKGEPGPLVTHEIQLQQEQAYLAAAKASHKQAALNRQRTQIKAPFNGRIRQESVDLGQYLKAGNVIGKLAGTDRAEILVPLPTDELHWLNIPKAGAKQHGSTARIIIPGETDQLREGQIIRSLGEIDPASRMATLAIAVNDPYQLAANSQGAELSNGQFVEIILQGTTIEQAIELPRHALRENDNIWIMDQDNRLRIVSIEVIRREPKNIVARATLADGTKLIVSPVPGAADGLLLRIAQ